MTDVKLDSLPLQVAVMTTRELKGASNLSDDRYSLKTMGLDEALGECWQTDAHFVTYALIDPQERELHKHPRCNKPVLSKLRRQGLELMHRCLVIDVDTEDHTPWDMPWLQDILDNLDDAEKQGSPAGKWAVWYSTTNGMRIIYKLSSWISPEEYEAKHRWLCRELVRYNVPADLKVSDWTRIFRLPFVVRDGKATWDSDSIELRESDRVVDPDAIKEINNAGDFSEDAFDYIEPVSLSMPSYDQCFDLLMEDSANGRRVQSKLYKEFMQQMKGREAWDILRGDNPIAAQGSRNSTIHQLMGQCIGMAFKLKGFCPEFLLGMFWEKLDELAPDADTPSWHAVAWDHICRLWSKEEAKEKFKQLEEKRQEEENEELVFRMLNGMREWCSVEEAPDLHADDMTALAYLSRHLICSHQDSYMLLDDTGRYGHGQYGAQQVIPCIRNSHLEGLIETKSMSPSGVVTDRTVTSILNAHSFPVQEAQAIVNSEGGTVGNIDSDRAIINHAMYKLNPELEPEYNELVDKWIDLMFGEHYEKACYWIGWALDFASGATVAALSLVGAPGAGKKMFVQGLAECLQRPALASHSDLTSGWGYGLLRSPFLVVNEGWPQSKNQGQAPSDQMKAMIGGDEIEIMRKNLPPVRLKCPTRIIMTANDFEVVSMLGRGKELTRETTEALAVRLFNVQLDRRASEWLRGLGGFSATQGWIEGDNGERSDYTIAKHFLWLHQNRGDRDNPLISPQRRLVVEGNMDDEDLNFMLRTQSGSAPLVIETIVMMLESRQRPPYGFHIHESRGQAFILASAILNYYRTHLREEARETLTEKQISSVLTNVSINEKKHAYILAGAESMDRRHWHELDLFVLDRACERSGMSNTRIKGLLHNQRNANSNPVPEERQENQQETLEHETRPATMSFNMKGVK